MIPARLVLATANPGKVSELGALVREWGPVEVTTLAAFPTVRLRPDTEAAPVYDPAGTTSPHRVFSWTGGAAP